jgi:putative flippase GtrA
MNSPLLKSFIKFLMVGVLNTCIGLTVTYLALEGLHLNYWVSTGLGNGCGAVMSFFLNRRFTFQSKISFLRGSSRFFLVVLTCYYSSYQLGLLLSGWLLGGFGVPPNVQIVVAVLLGSALYTLTNFFGQRWFVFSSTTRLELSKDT